VSTKEKNDRPVIVGLGEVLWDVFPDGPRFGGAPANYACSVAALSSDVDAFMVSSVGQDDLGRQAEAELRQRGVDTSTLQSHEKQTGKVDILVDDQGIATYEFAADTAWDNLKWTPELESLAQRTTAVCFGSLGQRSPESRRTMQAFVSATNAQCLKIFDINLRPPFFDDDVIVESLELANVLKLNDDELPVVTKLSNLQGTEAQQLEAIAERWNLTTIALTRGANGAAIFHEGSVSESDPVSTDVIDTVGAGDSFTATMTLGLLAGKSPIEICQHACRVAAYVCSQAGATPAIPDDLRW